MKISYVGNYTHSHCTEVHIAKSLESLGHQVNRIQEQPRFAPGWIRQVADDTDLFLYTRTWGDMVTLSDLALLKERGITTASYHLDLYLGLKREDGLQTDPFWRTDYVFTPDGDPKSQKRFTELGINHHYLPPGVFNEECYIAPQTEFKHDVLFVGGGDRVGSGHGYGHKEYPYRDELITFLYDNYGSFGKYGNPQPTVRNHELNVLYANSKVTVGDSLIINGHTNYTSDRLFESTGRGAFTIYPYINGIADMFIDGKEIVYYKHGDLRDLKAKIDYYLEHDDEREAIRIAGHKRTKDTYTYMHRLREALRIINE